MKKAVQRIITPILKKILEYRLEQKVKKAVRLSKSEDRKYIVFIYAGKPMLATKKRLKFLVKTRFFKKGITMQHIENTAYFITK